MVLPIVGLTIEAINSGNSAVLRFGAGRIKPSFSNYYLSLAKSQAAVPADDILFPHHRQYLFVAGYAGRDFRCEVSDILFISFRGRQIAGYMPPLFPTQIFSDRLYAETGFLHFGLCFGRLWTVGFQSLLF